MVQLPFQMLGQPPSYIESLIKVPEPPILPFFKPDDYVEVLAQLHEELESCSPLEKSKLNLLQYQVFKGLGELKYMRRSLHSALLTAETVLEKLVFRAWLKYENQGEELISDLLSSCGKCAKEFRMIDVAPELPAELPAFNVGNGNSIARTVSFLIGEEKIMCDRQKMACLSAPFQVMLNGGFKESFLEAIYFSENNISPPGMRVISEFSITGDLKEVCPSLSLEILVFADKFCCDTLKDACDRKLAYLVSSRLDTVDLLECDAVDLLEFAIEKNAPFLAASCLQVFLHQFPETLKDVEVVAQLLCNANKQQRSIMVGSASFSLYCLLSEVLINLDPRSDNTVNILEHLVDCAEDTRQKIVAHHQLGCVRLLRKEYDNAEQLFDAALSAGHIYSVVGLARLSKIRGHQLWAYEKLSSVISPFAPLGWMYQERSLYCEGDSKEEDLEKATELDPTLTYPYMYRAASLMWNQNAQAAIREISRVLGFKLALECLELRFCFYLACKEYQSAICDIQAILTLAPDYRMFDGRDAACQLRTLLREHVENWTTAYCWDQLYDKRSSVDDIGSLSVIYQMLESDAAKGVSYFTQYLFLLRLNCPEAAMRSLQLARQHASSDHERLVYEGWILYDRGYCAEGLQKAEESINLKRSFEAFFLKGYALADSSLDQSCSSVVVGLFEDALKCPSNRLREGQALINLGIVYGDWGKLDKAANCYVNALEIGHTRAHQGLARVHFLRNDKNAAYEEMNNLIEKGRNNASAYEKRAEYCERELRKADLETVIYLDPLRVFPYRYFTSVLMDNYQDEEAIAEISRAIAFKADLSLLCLRALFHEHVGNVTAALRDCRAALTLDPTHRKMLKLQSRVNTQEP